MIKYQLRDGHTFYMTEDQLEAEGGVPPFLKELSILHLLRAIGRREYTFVEVGAFIGTYSIRLADHYGQVIAFEPNPNNYEILKRNIEENGKKNVRAYDIALSDTDGEAVLHLRGPQSSFFGTHAHREAITVKVARVDGIIDKADVVKIDCEGAETLVVKGMDKIIHLHHPTIVIEHHELRGFNRETIGPIKNILKPLGYIMLEVDEFHRAYYHPSRPREELRLLLARHIVCHCLRNLATGRPWYHGLPYNWWWGMSLLDFMAEIENHVIEEEEWLKLV